MQSDQKIGLCLLIALTGFGLALGFGRRAPDAALPPNADLSPVAEALDVALIEEPADASPSTSTSHTAADFDGSPAEVDSRDGDAVKPAIEATGRPHDDPDPYAAPPSSRVVLSAARERRQQVEPSQQRDRSRPSGRRPAADDRTPLRPYVIRSGDTLSGIAGRELGDVNRYADIYNANRELLSNPNDIRIGQEILIPVR